MWSCSHGLQLQRYLEERTLQKEHQICLEYNPYTVAWDLHKADCIHPFLTAYLPKMGCRLKEKMVDYTHPFRTEYLPKIGCRMMDQKAASPLQNKIIKYTKIKRNDYNRVSTSSSQLRTSNGLKCTLNETKKKKNHI